MATRLIFLAVVCVGSLAFGQGTTAPPVTPSGTPAPVAFGGGFLVPPVATPASSAIAAPLKAAQRERVRVLSELVRAVNEEFKVGASKLAQVAAAENELSNAVLTSTDDPERRIALLTKQLDRASNLVKEIQALHDAGAEGGTQCDLLGAKSLYLGIKVKLLQENSNAIPTTNIYRAADNAAYRAADNAATHPEIERGIKFPMLNFEYLSNGLSRAKVEGGWFVRSNFAQSITFYPDPKHEWNGGSMK